MAYYVIPTEKDFKKNPSFKGMKYRDVFPEDVFVCDTCGKVLAGNDRYIVVRTDAEVKRDNKPMCRHITCDPVWMGQA